MAAGPAEACSAPAHVAAVQAPAAAGSQTLATGRKLTPAAALRRSFEHVELAAEPGGPLGEGSAFPITPQQRFSLEQRGELLGETSEPAALLGSCPECLRLVVFAVRGLKRHSCKVPPMLRPGSERNAAGCCLTPPAPPAPALLTMCRRGGGSGDAGCGAAGPGGGERHQRLAGGGGGRGGPFLGTPRRRWAQGRASWEAGKHSIGLPMEPSDASMPFPSIPSLPSGAAAPHGLPVQQPCPCPPRPADFLATHPTASIDGVVLRLRDHFVASGRLFPPDQAMCRCPVAAGWLAGWLGRGGGRQAGRCRRAPVERRCNHEWAACTAQETAILPCRPTRPPPHAGCRRGCCPPTSSA